MSLDRTIASTIHISKNEPKSLVEQMVKLSEEHGELAVAVLMSLGLKGTRKSKQEIKENLLEEGCDCLLMILSIIHKSGFDTKQIDDMMQKKLKKWKNRLNKVT